jgi:uncharacterized damage-inducible protein DinB
MLSELIATFYQYNAWANARMLDTTALLSPDQFLASPGASDDSVRDTLGARAGRKSSRSWMAALIWWCASLP